MPKKGKILKPILDIEAAVMARCNIFLGLSTASANVKTKTNELIGSLQLHTVNVVSLNQKFDQINAILKGFNGEVDQIKKDYIAFGFSYGQTGMIGVRFAS